MFKALSGSSKISTGSDCFFTVVDFDEGPRFDGRNAESANISSEYTTFSVHQAIFGTTLKRQTESKA